MIKFNSRQWQKYLKFTVFFLIGFSASLIPHILSGNLPLSPTHIEQTARQITVRIFSTSALGSGVIIKHQNQHQNQHQNHIYTVVTNHHVVANNPENNYRILTPDGKTYPAKLLPLDRLELLPLDRPEKSLEKSLEKLDVALLEFSSSTKYQIAKQAKHQQLAIGEIVYAVGFPNWQWLDKNTIENTGNQGLKAFRLTVGKVGMKLARPLKAGYQLGYTNDIAQGMSGGAILNKRGELVGINGRGKYPLAGIDAFKFADGSQPSLKMFEQMETLSWGIPISNFGEYLSKHFPRNNMICGWISKIQPVWVWSKNPL